MRPAPDIADANRGGREDEWRARSDREPFEDFYRREFPHLLVLARALVGRAYDEDVVQETLLAAYHRWPEIAAMSSPGGYVRGICLHKAISVVRRRTLERRLLGRVDPLTSADGPPDDSDEFWSHVRMLPRRQAQSVALHYALDLPVAEVAEILDCAVGTVKAHLHRARTSLAVSLGGAEEPS